MYVRYIPSTPPGGVEDNRPANFSQNISIADVRLFKYEPTAPPVAPTRDVHPVLPIPLHVAVLFLTPCSVHHSAGASQASLDFTTLNNTLLGLMLNTVGRPSSTLDSRMSPSTPAGATTSNSSSGGLTLFPFASNPWQALKGARASPSSAILLLIEHRQMLC